MGRSLGKGRPVVSRRDDQRRPHLGRHTLDATRATGLRARRREPAAHTRWSQPVRRASEPVAENPPRTLVGRHIFTRVG
jgi:hypothetical protein